MTKTLFITGTDTDSGKTTVTAALMQAARSLSLKVLGLKPVASGCELRDNVLINTDVSSIHGNSSFDVPYEKLSCYKFPPAIAPHIAAAESGVNIDTSVFTRRADGLVSEFHPDVFFIEGAGGWYLPLSDCTFMSDWVAARGLPVIITVGARLGFLNHAVLTRNEIMRAGCRVAGYVVNHADPHMERFDENIAWLKNYFKDIPLLGEIPHVQKAELNNLGKYIDSKILTEIL